MRDLAEEPQPIISAIQNQRLQRFWDIGVDRNLRGCISDLLWKFTLFQMPFFVLILGKMPSGIKTNIKSASMHPYQRWMWTAASTLRWSVLSWGMKLSFAQTYLDGYNKKNTGFQQETNLSSTVNSYATWGKWPNFSEPVFSFVNGDNTYLIGLLWGLKWENECKTLSMVYELLGLE